MQNTNKAEAKKSLRLLSYNIQGGIATHGYHHYLMKSWQHVLPHAKKQDNLDEVASLISQYDIVALQETDAGSFRNRYTNITEYLANKACFPHWFDQINRNMGKLAQHSNGLLCRYKPINVIEHRLPGLIPGRGALMAQFDLAGHEISIISVHLALGRKTRMKQIGFISELIEAEKNVVLMGDFNCDLASKEMKYLFKRTHMCEPAPKPHTFPSWQPKQCLDHILITEGMTCDEVNVVRHGVSDHLPVLPVSIEINLAEINVKH